MPAPTRARRPAEPPATALKDQAFAALRGLILTGELEAGSFISERQMVERLGMSKTPIRVAFERLAQDGFVEILPQRGVRVRGLSREEIADHYDLRIALETWVARRAAARREPEALAALEDRIAAQERLRRKVGRTGKHAGAGEITTYIDEDAQFHATLAALAGNPEIERVLANQRERLARIVAQHIRTDPPLLVASIAEHREILDRVTAGDGERAARAMERHLERGRDALLTA